MGTLLVIKKKIRQTVGIEPWLMRVHYITFPLEPTNFQQFL